MRNEENICQYCARQRAITTFVKCLLKLNVSSNVSRKYYYPIKLRKCVRNVVGDSNIKIKKLSAIWLVFHEQEAVGFLHSKFFLWTENIVTVTWLKNKDFWWFISFTQQNSIENFPYSTLNENKSVRKSVSGYTFYTWLYPEYFPVYLSVQYFIKKHQISEKKYYNL